METMFEQIARDYMPMLLNWAYKKLGDREKAEDLTQEVLLQVFSAIRKSPSPITDQEHFLWKIAHYTWCSYLRGSQRRKLCVSMENLQLEDPRDFAEDYAQEELRREQTLRMRRQISLLNRLQREIMISFYIDGLSVREIAEKHRMTQSAVKWHLCQTRKKLKKEITDMENQEYVYRPRKLHMAISGTVDSMGSSDIVMLENSLTKQNLCLACYRQPKTPQELAGQLGIPMAYVEADLEWLTEREFMEMTGSGYATSFPIITSAEEQEQFAIFAKHRKVLSDVIIEGLTSAEDTIRGIGFYGCKAADLPVLRQPAYPLPPHPDIRPHGRRKLSSSGLRQRDGRGRTVGCGQQRLGLQRQHAEQRFLLDGPIQLRPLGDRGDA